MTLLYNGRVELVKNPFAKHSPDGSISIDWLEWDDGIEFALNSYFEQESNMEYDKATESNPLELAPCPFCGRPLNAEDPDTLHPNGIVWRETGEGRHYTHYRQMLTTDNMCYVVNCVEHYGGCTASIDGDSREDAIARWNKRVAKG